MWEYSLVTLDKDDPQSTFVLNDFGSFGWELVAINYWCEDELPIQYRYFFKRPFASTIPNPRDVLGYDDNDGSGGSPVKPKKPELVS